MLFSLTKSWRRRKFFFETLQSSSSTNFSSQESKRKQSWPPDGRDIVTGLTVTGRTWVVLVVPALGHLLALSPALLHPYEGQQANTVGHGAAAVCSWREWWRGWWRGWWRYLNKKHNVKARPVLFLKRDRNIKIANFKGTDLLQNCCWNIQCVASQQRAGAVRQSQPWQESAKYFMEVTFREAYIE